MVLTTRTTNTATVTAYANGLKAVADDTITVDVAATSGTYAPGLPSEGPGPSVPGLPNNGPNPGLANDGTNPNTSDVTVIIWGILGGVLVVLIVVYFLIRKKK